MPATSSKSDHETEGHLGGDATTAWGRWKLPKDGHETIVTVVAVNVLTTKAKEKRRGTKRGRILGFTTPWRKAIVTLAPGQKIEFFEGV